METFVQAFGQLLRGFLWVALWLCVGPIAESADKEKPNVLLIITDDQGYGDFSVNGNPVLKTPHLDRLAAQSVRFEQFHVNPLCAPTRAALLTGRYALRTGSHGVQGGMETMRVDEVTLGEVFREAGWRTGYFGKWHNGENYPYTPNGQGFDEDLGFHLGHWNNYFDTTLHHNGQPRKMPGFITDVLTDAALEFIGKSRARPWLCIVAYNAPHSPFQCPEKEFAEYKARGLDDELAAVYGMCANVDHNVGRVLEYLEASRAAENTLVVFLTDNGPNGIRFNAGMRGKKGNLTLGGVRVPCWVRWPARFREGRSVREITAHIDLLPTLLELTQIKDARTLPLDGRSLVPLMEGRTDDWADRTLFIQNTPKTARSIGSARTQRWHLVNEGKGYMLFDLESDPSELRDVSTRHPELTESLRDAYEKWWTEVSLGVREKHPPLPVGHDQENPAELSIAQAELGGGVGLNNRFPNNSWAVRWDGTEARASWTLEAAVTGEYEVRLRYINTVPDSKVRVTQGAATLDVPLPVTARKQVPSPDRVPRKETVEMDWSTITVGRLKLSAGRQTLDVRTPAGAPGFELKAVSIELR